MTDFNVTWPNGETEVVNEEHLTADAYALSRWGRDSADHVLDEFKVKIEAVTAAVSAVEAPHNPSEEDLAAIQAARAQAEADAAAAQAAGSAPPT